MLRRSVLGIGLAGGVSTFVGACGSGSTGSGSTGSTKSHGAATASSAASQKPLYDAESYPPPAIALDQLKKLYVYDQKSVLGALLTNTRFDPGLRIEDLTYSGVPGTTIPLYVVAPADPKALLPGVVFAGDAGTSRDALLPEVEALSRLGIVAALAHLDFTPTGDPQGDSTLMINAVIAQRRALDLLGRRDDVDPSRLAIIGYGWGGAQAQIVAGLDTRPLGVGVVASGGRWSRTAYRTAKAADATGYLDSLTRFDGVRYMTVAGKRQVLLQFGKQDATVSAAEANELAAATVGTKDRKDYDASHDLTAVPAAVADRAAFLRRVLRMK